MNKRLFRFIKFYLIVLITINESLYCDNFKQIKVCFGSASVRWSRERRPISGAAGIRWPPACLSVCRSAGRAPSRTSGAEAPARRRGATRLVARTTSPWQRRTCCSPATWSRSGGRCVCRPPDARFTTYVHHCGPEPILLLYRFSFKETELWRQRPLRAVKEICA